MMMPLKTGVDELDAMINEVSDPAESQCELLREHLESARNYVLGSMPREYALTLRLAKQMENCIVNPERRERVKHMIESLLAHEG
ncbi:MAG: hypothetical protein LAO79_11895 [Acidobacteriia bacterium]|nr:hypothetical protein [Terriglobia bacterium]